MICDGGGVADTVETHDKYLVKGPLATQTEYNWLVVSEMHSGTLVLALHTHRSSGSQL